VSTLCWAFDGISQNSITNRLTLNWVRERSVQALRVGNLIDDDFWLFSLIWKITCTEGCSWIMFDGRKLPELVIEMWMKNVVEIVRWRIVTKIYWVEKFQLILKDGFSLKDKGKNILIKFIASKFLTYFNFLNRPKLI
jgi:hypothetical protein